MAALTAFLLATTIAETGLGIANSRKQAKAARTLGELEGQTYDQQAKDALARGEEAAHQTEASSRILSGAQRVALAASGVDISSGSAADVQENDKRLAVLEEAQQRRNAAREAFGFTQSAQLARKGGGNAAAGFNNQAISTGLSGAASLFSIYRSWSMNRIPRATTTSSGSTGTSTASTSSGGYTGEQRSDNPFGNG